MCSIFAGPCLLLERAMIPHSFRVVDFAVRDNERAFEMRVLVFVCCQKKKTVEGGSLKLSDASAGEATWCWPVLR
jgi:hypothetical protein